MAQNACVPRSKPSSEHVLWFPEPGDVLSQSPTWIRRIGKSDDGEVVTLGMVLEEEPAARHMERITEHREGLELLIKVSQVVLGSQPAGTPERGGMGFTLLFFAGELASVLGFGELGSASVDPPLRRACLESVAAATLNATGCLVGGEWIRPAGRRY
jgi:hypothetical protein